MRARFFSFTVGLFAATLASGSAQAALYWTPWVSEEGAGPPSLCDLDNEAAVGFGCSGSYCDNVRQFCETIPFGVTVANYAWSPFFSEESSGVALSTSEGWYRHDTDNSHVCYYSGRPAVMTGVRCWGSYCDNVSIECANVVKQVGSRTVQALLTSCGWSGWYSEEAGPELDFGPNRYISGVECSGTYCDNKRFHVCSVGDPNAGVSDPNEPAATDSRDFKSASQTFSGSNLVTEIEFYGSYVSQWFSYYIDTNGAAGADFHISCDAASFQVLGQAPGQPGVYNVLKYQGVPTINGTRYTVAFPATAVEPVALSSLTYWFYSPSSLDRMPNSSTGLLMTD